MGSPVGRGQIQCHLLQHLRRSLIIRPSSEWVGVSLPSGPAPPGFAAKLTWSPWAASPQPRFRLKSQGSAPMAVPSLGCMEASQTPWGQDPPTESEPSGKGQGCSLWRAVQATAKCHGGWGGLRPLSASIPVRFWAPPWPRLLLGPPACHTPFPTAAQLAPRVPAPGPLHLLLRSARNAVCCLRLAGSDAGAARALGCPVPTSPPFTAVAAKPTRLGLTLTHSFWPLLHAGRDAELFTALPWGPVQCLAWNRGSTTHRKLVRNPALVWALSPMGRGCRGRQRG